MTPTHQGDRKNGWINIYFIQVTSPSGHVLSKVHKSSSEVHNWIEARALQPGEHLGHNRNGRPIILPSGSGWLSVSYAGAWAVVAVDRIHPIGVDAEVRSRILRDPRGCLRAISGLEEGTLRSPISSPDVLRVWTAKEALLKLVGTGLRTLPRTVHLRPDEHGATAAVFIGSEGLRCDIQPSLAEFQRTSKHQTGAAAVLNLDAVDDTLLKPDSGSCQGPHPLRLLYVAIASPRFSNLHINPVLRLTLGGVS